MALTQISTDGIKNGTITGSDLATNIDLVDNQRLRLGTGNDLEIFHNNDNSFINDSGTGQLMIQASGLRLRNYPEGHTQINCQDDVVELYYNNSKKFETQNLGVTVTGGVYPAATDTYQLGGSSLRWNELNIKSVIDVSDNGKIRMGDSDDLQIYHDGSNSRIVEGGTGSLVLQTSKLNVLNAAGTESMLAATENGAVELYFDGSKKFETQVNGVTVTGGVYADGLICGDNDMVEIGTGGDLQIFHNGTNSVIQNATGALVIKPEGLMRIQDRTTDEFRADFNDNGSVDLYHNGSKKFETTSSGVTVTGTINFGSGMGSGLNSNGFNINFADSDGSQDMAKFGTGGDLRIYHDSANSYIQNITGALRIYNHVLDVRNDTGNETILKGSANGSVELYYNNVKKLETTDVGITSLDTLITQGELRPGPDNDHSIGRSNRRYITIFAVNGSINTSDKNEKNTIIDSDLGLDFINKLKPKSYKWNKNDGKTHYGLIAQDLEETLTSLGKTIADFGGIYKEDDSPMGLGYSELIAPLIKAVQELSTEVAALKAA